MNKNGQVGGGLIGGIIAVTIGVIMATSLLMPTIKTTNTSGWSASEIALWAVAGLAVVIGVVLLVFNAFGVRT